MRFSPHHHNITHGKHTQRRGMKHRHLYGRPADKTSDSDEEISYEPTGDEVFEQNTYVPSDDQETDTQYFVWTFREDTQQVMNTLQEALSVLTPTPVLVTHDLQHEGHAITAIGLCNPRHYDLDKLNDTIYGTIKHKIKYASLLVPVDPVPENALGEYLTLPRMSKPLQTWLSHHTPRPSKHRFDEAIEALIDAKSWGMFFLDSNMESRLDSTGNLFLSTKSGKIIYDLMQALDTAGFIKGIDYALVQGALQPANSQNKALMITRETLENKPQLFEKLRDYAREALQARTSNTAHR